MSGNTSSYHLPSFGPSIITREVMIAPSVAGIDGSDNCSSNCSVPSYILSSINCRQRIITDYERIQF